ncbi:alkaline phosphatase PhoX [Methyloversatilis sp.]|uniref:alkaline phosphatase PhoX n=1 Tax=Methyloversatilis sp. TaxID=2569862 RepID=UPI0027B9D25A|nr:alkaline phosphatase PhoX [Methyloversatilis sp.]
MQSRKLAIAAAIGLMGASAHQVSAADNTYFDNFTALAGNVAAGSLPESAPLQLSSPFFSQKVLADRNTQLGLGESNSGNWDMITANETGTDAGRYLYAPFETGAGGVQRTDLWTGVTKTIVASGTQGFVAGDFSRWTPWGTYMTAEESWGTNSTKGRLFEVTNPLADTASADFVHRNVVPRVSHEGGAFDKNNSFYFIDEFNGGSIYKYVSAAPTASNGNSYFDKGQTFVLKTNGGSNSNAVGAATWEAITTGTGTPLAGTVNAMVNVGGGTFSMDGRAAADMVGGTNYQRPEDLEMQVLANGDEVLYIATTTTNEVYSLNLATSEMKVFANRSTFNSVTGAAVGSEFTSPDNLAIDANGNIYIIEDQPGGRADIWFAQDADRDGVAESVSRWASLSTVGAEPTGLYFDKFNPNVAYVNVQHPASGNDTLLQITAVPEPETYVMFLAGLGLMGLMARRRVG